MIIITILARYGNTWVYRMQVVISDDTNQINEVVRRKAARYQQRTCNSTLKKHLNDHWLSILVCPVYTSCTFMHTDAYSIQYTHRGAPLPG